MSSAEESAPREPRGSDSHSDYTHSSLADSNYSLISGDEAVILTDDEDDTSTHDGIESIASIDDEDGVQEHQNMIESTSIEIDEVDTTLVQQVEQGSVIETTSSPSTQSDILDDSVVTTVQEKATTKVNTIPNFIKSSGPFKILYHGTNDETMHQIIEKIAQAIAVSSRGFGVDKASNRYSIIALSGFGDAEASPDVALIPSKGLELDVQACPACAQGRSHCRSPKSTKRPDLTINQLNDYYHIPGSLFKQRNALINIFSSSPPSVNYETPRMSTFSLDSFLGLDPVELNRHIASLIQANSRKARAMEHFNLLADKAYEKATPAIKKAKRVWRWCTDNDIPSELRLLHILVVSLVMSLFLGGVGIPMQLFMSHQNAVAGRLANENMVFRIMPQDGALGAHLPSLDPSYNHTIPEDFKEVEPIWKGLWMEPRDEPDLKRISRLLKPQEPEFVRLLQGSDDQLYMSLAQIIVKKDQAPVLWIYPSRMDPKWHFTRVNETLVQLHVDPRPRSTRLGIRVLTILDGEVVSGLHFRINPEPARLDGPLARLLPAGSGIHKAVSNELMALHDGAKAFALSTFSNMEKGLTKLSDESEAFKNYSTRNLARRQSLLKFHRAQVKELSVRIRDTIRHDVHECVGSVRALAKQAKAKANALKALKRSRVPRPQFKVNRKDWYKSKKLGKARAGARKLINRVAGRDIYNVE